MGHPVSKPSGEKGADASAENPRHNRHRPEAVTEHSREREREREGGLSEV